MSKKHTHRNKTHLKTQTSRVNVEKAKDNNQSGRISILKNVLMFFAFAIIIWLFKEKNNGYKWVHKTLIGDNLKKIEQYKDLTFEQRYEVKLGFNYKYLEAIKNNTPDTAVILMPPASVVFPKDGQTDFKTADEGQSITNATWSSYFLYPRKLVYEDKKELSPLYNKATHVAIANNWGYEKLKYNVSGPRPKHHILPINNPPAQR